MSKLQNAWSRLDIEIQRLASELASKHGGEPADFMSSELCAAIDQLDDEVEYEVELMNKATELAAEPKVESIPCYDAGLLNDYGGGDVDWWQDYIRAELGRAHDFYQSLLT